MLDVRLIIYFIILKLRFGIALNLPNQIHNVHAILHQVFLL